VSVARKIEYEIRERDGLDIRIYPLALTHEQCLTFELPRTPLKESDRRRKEFETTFGAGATELDALEALHPGELTKIIREAILRYYDEDLSANVARAASAARVQINNAMNEVCRGYKDRIDEVEAEVEAINNAVQAEIDAILERFRPREEAIEERMSALLDQITDALEEVDIDDIEIPEPREADEMDNPLFDSTRDYLTQIEHYRGRRTRAGNMRRGKLSRAARNGEAP
jgi:hypothetical protein